MNNKMLHRGPMDRLTTFSNLPLLTACVFLFLQIQIFHALPTAINPTSSHIDSSTNTGLHTSGINYASAASTAYDPVYPYSSYRPGLVINSYRPFAYQKDLSLRSGPDVVPDVVQALHPNSVYSRPSASAGSASLQNIDKYAIEKQNYHNEKKVTVIDTPALDTNAREAKSIDQIHSVSYGNTKPRLNPLPSLSSFNLGVSKSVENNQADKTSPDQKSTSHSETASVDEEQRRSVELPGPPPFAPELDPRYESRQAGLGPISLLDQAGPFW